MAVKPEIFFTDARAVTLLALTGCLLWGSAYPAIKSGYALLHIVPEDAAGQLLFAACRFTLAGLFVLAFAALSGLNIIIREARAWGRLCLMGLSMTTLQYVFFYIGMSHTTGVKASILSSSPFFSAILAHFFCVGDRLNRRTVLGCLLGFLGIFAANRGGVEGAWDFTLLGEGFVVISSFCLAAAAIYGKKLSLSLNPIVMTGWQLFIGGLVLMLIGFGAGGHISGFTGASIALLVYMALLSASAFAIYAILMKYNPVSRIAIFNFSIPVFGAALSALFLGESLWEWKNLAALLLVSGGIALVNYKK